MKLKDHYLTPVGGWTFSYSFTSTDRYPLGKVNVTRNDSSSLEDFQRKVRNYFIVNDIPIAENLDAMIEDYICTRQSADRCYFTRQAGDVITQGIHATLRAIDSFAGTSLYQTGRRCSSCSRRRTNLNS